MRICAMPHNVAELFPSVAAAGRRAISGGFGRVTRLFRVHEWARELAVDGGRNVADGEGEVQFLRVGHGEFVPALGAEAADRVAVPAQDFERERD